MPRRKTFPTTSIPQRDQLQDVRRVVEALAEHPGALASLAALTKLSQRHADYARHAARTLGWLSDDDEWAVTPSGKKLISEGPGGLGERSRFRIAIEQSPVLKHVAPDLLRPAQPKKTLLASRIRKFAPELSEETAARRAQCLLAWREQALDPQLPLLGNHRAPAERSFSLPFGRHLHRMNPWWQEGRPPSTPKSIRDVVLVVERRMTQRLAPIVVVRGPRQVGKTTAQLQVIERLLETGTSPKRIMRLQCDELPSVAEQHEQLIAAVEWFEASILKRSLNEAMRELGPIYLFFDEVQNVATWTAQLKHLVDTTSKELRVFVTGSSALKIALGRDSLAGRLHTIDIGTLTLREISSIRFGESLPSVLAGAASDMGRKEFWLKVRANGSVATEERGRAFAAFSTFGGYPMAHRLIDQTWAEVAIQLKETVIDRVISHDLRVSQRGRAPDSGVLAEIFRLGCRYVGQAPSAKMLADEARRGLNADVDPERIRHYLKLLDMSLLLRCVPASEMRLKRNRGPGKICLVDHGLRACWLQEVVPLEPHLLDDESMCTLAGRIVESVVGSYLLHEPTLALSHFPERPGEPEVDFVLAVGDRRVPLEVKYRRRIDPERDLVGLRAFMDKPANNAPFGILIAQAPAELDDPRIVCLPLPSLLSM
jgi:predicted AAA+ superfamily ATPase